MAENGDYISDLRELINQARYGHQESQNRLAKLAEPRLYEYAYRCTLRKELSEDIVQESLLEMVRILGKLEKADRFWPWIYGIVHNKLRNCWRREKIRKTVPLGNVSDEMHSQNSSGNQEGLEHLLREELQQIVFAAMRELKPRHREVMGLRCYENMKYAQIAEVMGCSEFSARMLFLRAKNSLRKHLTRRGISKGGVLMALILFGKMTSQSPATAAQISVTASSLKIGVTASLVGAAASKTGVLTLAGAIAIGAAVLPSVSEKLGGARGPKQVKGSVPVICPLPKDKEGNEECWYYYPEGPDGPVMMRKQIWGDSGRPLYCPWIQSEGVNYLYDESQRTVYLTNHRIWQQDLSVTRLPTDGRELLDFLALVEGRQTQIERVEVCKRCKWLWVIASRNTGDNIFHTQVRYHPNLLKEQYFQYNGTNGINRIDKRDEMHIRGWSCFLVSGQLAGRKVSGKGITPFTYEGYQKQRPWLKLQIAESVVGAGERQITHSQNKVQISFAGGQSPVVYNRDTFFRGLPRNWMGLHTIDTVRRDAALKKLWFETQPSSNDNKVEVIIKGKKTTLVYTIDMIRDVIDRISFFANDIDSAGPTGHPRLGRDVGFLEFSYLDEAESNQQDFNEPNITGYACTSQTSGISWLLKLVEND